MTKLKVGILGATGMVGQRFVTLLNNHPWFEVVCLAASPSSSGKTYADAVEGRWLMADSIPENITNITVKNAGDVDLIKNEVDFVFSALNMEKTAIRDLENAYAQAGVPVVSNNSAHRWTEDIPMIIPEVNPHHLDLIEIQRRNRGWDTGFIVTKPNCSIQSYVPVISALIDYAPERLFVTTMQAISGSGKLLKDSPQIHDNVIPLAGEEIKSEQEPLKIFGKLTNNGIQNHSMNIAAHCHRVSAEDGHIAAISVGFKNKPSADEIMQCLKNWEPETVKLALPSAPSPTITYTEGDDRPQTRLDRNTGNGMGIVVGRLRDCPLLDYKMLTLSHNTIRGAAGGAILTAELLHSKEYL